MEILQSDDVLRDEILSDARKKAERIIKKARQDSENILKEVDRQITDFKQNLADKQEKEVTHVKELAFSSIEMEVNQESIKQAGSFVSEVFDEIYAMIMDFSKKELDYGQIMLTMLREAASQMKSTEYYLEIAEDELALLGKEQLAGLTFDDQGKIKEITLSQIQEGMILYSADKKIACYISIRKFLDELIQQERKHVYEILKATN